MFAFGVTGFVCLWRVSDWVASIAGAAVLLYRAATSGPALLAGGSLILVTGALGWVRDAERDDQ